MDDLIKDYFRRGLQYSEILNNLSECHNIIISLKTLKRRLKAMNLYRKKNYTDLGDIINSLNESVENYGQLHGYRWQHQRLIQSGAVVTQDTVRLALQMLDPAGVEYRKRRRLRRRLYSNPGPNFTWHLDSYDKLKPYGICINGCIDGYSRKILWLNAGTNTSNSRIIAGHYLDCILECKGIPLSIRSDHGTENAAVERLQTLLRQRYSNSDRPPFLKGTSQHNQRIESWWAQLRKHQSQYWINLLSELKDQGLFDGLELDKALIQFCFLGIIRRELNEVVETWNNHRMQRSRNAIAPIGRPYNLYNTPGCHGALNYLIPIQEDNILNACSDETHVEMYPCEENVYHICADLMMQLNMSMPEEPLEAADLYIFLRNEIRNL